MKQLQQWKYYYDHNIHMFWYRLAWIFWIFGHTKKADYFVLLVNRQISTPNSSQLMILISFASDWFHYVKTLELINKLSLMSPSDFRHTDFTPISVWLHCDVVSILIICLNIKLCKNACNIQLMKEKDSQ